MNSDHKRTRSEAESKMADEDMSSGYEGHMSKRQKTDEGMHGTSGRVSDKYIFFYFNPDLIFIAFSNVLFQYCTIFGFYLLDSFVH